MDKNLRREAVRQVASKPRPGTSKGKGRGGARPRKITEHVIRTAAGPRVTIEFKKGLDAPAILTALREATAKVEVELAKDQAAA